MVHLSHQNLKLLYAECQARALFVFLFRANFDLDSLLVRLWLLMPLGYDSARFSLVLAQVHKDFVCLELVKPDADSFVEQVKDITVLYVSEGAGRALVRTSVV